MKQLNLLFAGALVLATGNLLCGQGGHRHTRCLRTEKSDRELWKALRPKRRGGSDPTGPDIVALYALFGNGSVSYDRHTEDYDAYEFNFKEYGEDLHERRAQFRTKNAPKQQRTAQKPKDRHHKSRHQ